MGEEEEGEEGVAVLVYVFSSGWGVGGGEGVVVLGASMVVAVVIVEEGREGIWQEMGSESSGAEVRDLEQC